MKGIQHQPMTKSSTHGSMTIHVDSREFNRMLDNLQEDIARVMEVASGEALSYAKTMTTNYLYAHASITPLAKLVAHSLDYDKRGDRKATIQGDNVTLEAKFGSRGPRIHGGMLGGEGVHTEPDDTGGTYQIAVALQRGVAAGNFRFTHARGTRGAAGGAAVHGRQVGSMGGPTAWYGAGGVGYQYGFPATDYLGHAERYFQNRIKNALENKMKRFVG